MKRLLIILSIVTSFILMSHAAAVSAQANPSPDGGAGCSTSFLGFPTWYKYLDVGPQAITNETTGVSITDPCAITGPSRTYTDSRGNQVTEIDIGAAVGRVAVAIVEILLRLAALVSVGFVMFGGFRYVTSQGEPDSTKSARQTIQNALIGLVISLIATGIVAFVAAELTSSPAAGGARPQQAQ